MGAGLQARGYTGVETDVEKASDLTPGIILITTGNGQ